MVGGGDGEGVHGGGREERGGLRRCDRWRESFDKEQSGGVEVSIIMEGRVGGKKVEAAHWEEAIRRQRGR